MKEKESQNRTTLSVAKRVKRVEEDGQEAALDLAPPAHQRRHRRTALVEALEQAEYDEGAEHDGEDAELDVGRGHGGGEDGRDHGDQDGHVRKEPGVEQEGDGHIADGIGGVGLGVREEGREEGKDFVVDLVERSEC